MADTWLYINPLMQKTHEVSILWSCIFAVLTMCPIMVYVLIGWPWKRNEIFVMLDDASKKQYLLTFQRKICTIENAAKEFEEFYDRWYGRNIFIISALVLFILSVYFGSLLAETGMHFLYHESNECGNSCDYIFMPLTATASIGGAFLFVSWDLAVRAVRRDMFWSDVLLGALRLAVCVPVGYAIGSFAKDAVGPFLAFAASALPIDVLSTVVRRYLNKTLKLEIGADTNHDQLIKLSGIDAAIADRIANADITSISQLAYSDPIQLAMRTNLGFAYLLDGISQAQAWMYLGDALERIRSIGFRGAYELKTLYDDFQKSGLTEDEKSRLDDLAGSAAKRLKLTKVEFDNMLCQVACDPYTKFMVEVFSQAPRQPLT